MRFIQYLFLVLASMIMLVQCKSKKKPSLSGDDPVEVTDFIEFFPETKLPFHTSDTAIGRKENDSLLISQAVFTQFVPDSILQKAFGKNAKPKIYPLARTKADGAETYLFSKILGGDRKAVFVFAFDKKNNYLDGMSLLRVDQLPATQQYANMDKSFGLNIMTNRKNADGSMSEGKEVYGLGRSSGKFELIMTEALDDKATELINPIDTVSRKHKYAADYGSGKLNLISIRDGRKKDRLSFFIHFEKNNGECTGELKGEAIIKSANTAEYRVGGDPCVLRMTFTSSAVILKELEGCGAHRGLRCSFDGSYAKRKAAAKKK